MTTYSLPFNIIREMAITPPPDNGHGTRLWRSRRPGTSHFFAILGCTDLRIGVSGAKFDARADFEVRLPPAFPKPCENIEKLREMCDKQIFSFFMLTIVFWWKASECI